MDEFLRKSGKKSEASLFREIEKEKLPEGIQHTGAEAKRRLVYQVAALQGIGGRKDQQDSYLTVNEDDVVAIRDHGLLVAVADGIGGLSGGKEASTIAVNSLAGAFGQMNENAPLAPQLQKAVIAANTAVYQRFNARGGSTLIACVIFDEKLYFASVGDSSLYLLRGEQLCRLNREQNSQNLINLDTIRAGTVDPAPAEADPHKAALSHFVGMRELDEIDQLRRPLQLRAGDILLACSDGISGFMPEEAVRESLLSGSPRDVCSRLEENIFRANANYQDNYTALVVQCRY